MSQHAHEILLEFQKHSDTCIREFKSVLSNISKQLLMCKKSFETLWEQFIHTSNVSQHTHEINLLQLQKHSDT